jgi:hypothetical protein
MFPNMFLFSLIVGVTMMHVFMHPTGPRTFSLSIFTCIDTLPVAMSNV